MLIEGHKVTSGVQLSSLSPIRRPHLEDEDFPPASCSVLQEHRNEERIGGSDSSTRRCQVHKKSAVDPSKQSRSS